MSDQRTKEWPSTTASASTLGRDIKTTSPNSVSYAGHPGSHYPLEPAVGRTYHTNHKQKIKIRQPFEDSRIRDSRDKPFEGCSYFYLRPKRPLAQDDNATRTGWHTESGNVVLSTLPQVEEKAADGHSLVSLHAVCRLIDTLRTRSTRVLRARSNEDLFSLN